MHHIACTNQPFAVVQSEGFKALLPVSDRQNLKGSKHFREWVLPRVYSAVKKEVSPSLSRCEALSFTFGLCDLALLLDARFKDRIESDRVKFSANLAAWIQEEFELGEEMVEEELRSPPPKRTTSFFGKLNQLFTDEESSNEEQASHELIEIKAYNKEKFIDREADPLKYLKVKRSYILFWPKFLGVIFLL